MNRRKSRIVKVCVLASSSSGNSIFVSTGRTRVLIDIGLSRREIVSRLNAVGETPEALDAILISHEHCDHVGGLVSFMKRFSTPVYLSRLTAPTIDWGECVPIVESFQPGQHFHIGDMKIETFTLPHDAIDPVGFCIIADGVKIAAVNDLGYMPESVKFHLRETDFLMLESNHDLEMLKVGPYPWSVKQRVMGRNGHLSNDMVCDFILNGLDGCVKTLLLGHLSEHNNHPAIVHFSAARALSRRCLFPRLIIAESRTLGQVFEV